MGKAAGDQVTRNYSGRDFKVEIQAFIIDRKARGLADNTLVFYEKELGWLVDFLNEQEVTHVLEVTPNILRQYLLRIGERRNPGGVLCAYRTMRAFFHWYEEEAEPENWRNPIRKVKAPKNPVEPLEPLDLEHLKAMLKTCGKDICGIRDQAILLSLLDTGCRASEFVALNIADVDMIKGVILVRETKGNKHRVVMIGAKSRRLLNRYLRLRTDIAPESPLWVTSEGKRFTYEGLRQIVRRRAARAGVPEPNLHSFRRAFALMSLRNGMDIYSLQRLMGHTDLSVLRRYLAQTEGDLQAAHQKCGPVDNLF